MSDLKCFWAWEDTSWGQYPHSRNGNMDAVVYIDEPSSKQKPRIKPLCFDCYMASKRMGAINFIPLESISPEEYQHYLINEVMTK